MSRAVHRLWGSAGKPGELHAAPVFADELAAQCNGKLALRAPAVTRWTYGQQLEHLYRASHYVLDRLEEAMSGENASGRRGFWGHGLMVGGFIPRGFFPTIPQLEPAGGAMSDIEPLKESLMGRLSQIRWDWNQIRSSRGKSRHPRMKFLTGSEWLFFADIHHRHHLAIMRDMRNAAR